MPHSSLLLTFYLLTFSPIASAADVLEIANSFGEGGGYKWAGTGVPHEIRFKGRRILSKGDGTYCCGYTFAVALQVAERRGLVSDKTVSEIREFQKHWYGVNDQSGGTLCVYAVEKLGIGKAVAHADARPGDMMQFWRSDDSGHSVIFLKWLQHDGQTVGFQYRSSQQATCGIGNRSEYFNDTQKGKVLRDRTHICRIGGSEGVRE